jgi:HK97 family phage major capsid protein
LDQIQELENAIAEARAQLDKADQQQRADLETQIGQKTAALEALRDQQQQQYASEREELDALRREKRERETRESVQGLVAQVASGVKATQAQEQERLQSMISEELKRAFGGQNPALDVQSLMAGALTQASQARLGRKFVPDDQATGDGRQATEWGRKGGPAYLAAHKMGEKPTFLAFLLAAGRKDDGTIRDIQSYYGMQTGRKALIEGGAAIDSTGGPSGGWLVPVEFSTQIIERLYPQVVVRRAGATVQTMNSPVYRQPRLTASASASYVGETVPIPSSQPTFDQFSLSAKKLTALVPISNELVNDSDPAVEQIVVRDMARAIGLKEDYTFLLGTGSSTVPAGILTASGITTINATGTNGDAIAYTTLTRMIGALDAANVPEINRVWLANPRIREAVSNVTDSQGRPLFQDYQQIQLGSLLQRVPTLFGYPFLMSTQMPLGTTGTGATADLALVDMGYIVIGQMAELELRTSNEGSYVDGSSNTHSAYQDDLTLFRAIARHDIAPLHPEAIVRRRGLLY